MASFTELADYPGYFIAHSPPRLQRVIGGISYVCTQTLSSKKDAYWSITVKDRQGKFVKRNMHRLLMQTFVPNLENKAHVNHIDGNKSNNKLSNLEWSTPKENAMHAVLSGLTDTTKSRKPVYQYLLNGTFVAEFCSDVEAEAVTGITRQNISKATLGLRAHAGYFQWSREKHSAIPAVSSKYVKSYIYKGKCFNTLAELADSLGYLNNLSAFSLMRLKKAVRAEIQTIYYD